MMGVRRVWILQILVTIPKIWCEGEVVGAPCEYSLDGSRGLCVFATDCEIAVNLTRFGYKLDRCGYQNLNPIICCPGIVPPKTSEEFTVTPIRTTMATENKPIFTSDHHTENHFGSPESKENSVQKCMEYSRPVQNEISAIALLLNPDPVRFIIPDCDYNALPLIVGGSAADEGEFPHMAAIAYERDNQLEYNCGGTLISEYFVLTAAHCTVDIKGVRLGVLDLKRNDPRTPKHYYLIDEIFTHPDYKDMYNDIALIRLARRVQFTKDIRPACLWTSDQLNAKNAVATGWGLTAFAGTSSDILLKVSLSLMSTKKCSRMFQANRELPDGIRSSQICAGSKNADTCQGDSGGPLTVNRKENQCIFYVIGITSFGKPCGGQNAVGVYTRVSSYISWIEGIVWP